MPRAKLIDKNGRFLVPVVYRLRTPDGTPVEVGGDGDAAGTGQFAPRCDHCGAELAVRPEPDMVSADGSFIGGVKTDTREQAPYSFEGIGWDAQDGGGPGKTLTIETVRGTLRSGDYSLLGFETRVAIERKSLADAYSTIGQGRARFERELERLASYSYAAVMIEATWEEICTQPPPHTKLSPKTVVRSIEAWDVRYPAVRWWFAGPRRLAEVTTFRLLERFLKEEFQRGKQRDAAA